MFGPKLFLIDAITGGNSDDLIAGKPLARRVAVKYCSSCAFPAQHGFGHARNIRTEYVFVFPIYGVTCLFWKRLSTVGRRP